MAEAAVSAVSLVDSVFILFIMMFSALATGGAVDDAYVYMYEEDRYMLVVNASNTDKDLAHFATILPQFNCTVTNMTDKCASIAVQGPESDKILSALIGGPVPVGPKKNDLGFAMMEGRKVWLSRTGYTGEPIGYELFIESAEAVWLWNRLIELGAKPIALGARDTLRLEAGLPLYGHEMGEDTPDGSEIKIFSVPLSRFAVSFAEEKGDFIGREALAKQAGIEMEKSELHAKAMTWEIRHAGRTPRVARQFIASLHI